MNASKLCGYVSRFLMPHNSSNQELDQKGEQDKVGARHTSAKPKSDFDARKAIVHPAARPWSGLRKRSYQTNPYAPNVSCKVIIADIIHSFVCCLLLLAIVAKIDTCCFVILFPNGHTARGRHKSLDTGILALPMSCSGTLH